MKLTVKNIIPFLFLLMLIKGVEAQKEDFYFETGPVLPNTSASLTFKNDFGTQIMVRKAKLMITTGFDEPYKWGKATDDAPFEYRVKFDLREIGSATATSHELIINNAQPQGYYFKDLQEYILPVMDEKGFSVSGFQVELKALEAINNQAFKEVEDAFSVKMSYEIAYGIPATKNLTLAQPEVPAQSKTVFLSWVLGAWKFSPGYEVQIVRLYNHDETKVTDEKSITAKVNWSNALSYLVEEPVEKMQLSLAEGTGYYAWRVRSIGTLAKGGFGHSDNYGSWSSESPWEGQFLSLSPSTVNHAVFYYEDPDADKNYSFNRVFAEDELVKESATYATTLNQVKQTQVYLPSKDKTLITQTVLDYLGRPALSTLPGPVVGKTNGFKEQVLLDENGNLYKAKQFDGETNYTHPEKIQINGVSSIFNYYSDENEDLRIPNSEGYPFTRVRFANDATGRAIESSGVGATHMLGNQSEGMGRTVRAFYGTPSQDELIELFGDEAPDNEQVVKVVNLDQNNTASISYKTVQGNVIATSLTFNDNSDALKPVDTYASNPRTVKDKLSNNASCEGDFVNSKRLAFPEATALTLGYKVKCATLDGLCVGGPVECNYLVYITIFNVLTGETIRLPKEGGNNLDQTPCNDDGYKIIQFTSETLPAGEYVIQKHLASGKPEVEGAKEEVENSILPLGEFINDRMDAVQCSGELLKFYNDLRYLAAVLNNNRDIPVNQSLPFDCEGCSKRPHQFPEEFIEKYNKNRDVYQMLLFNKQGDSLKLNDSITVQNMPVKANIQSACCNIDLNVFYDPPFDCPTFETWTSFIEDLDSGKIDIDKLKVDPYWHKNRFDPIKNGFPLDLEGYAISLIRENKGEGTSVQEAATIFYKYMGGWHVPGTFNQMVFHMITDQYNSTGMGVNAGDCSRKGLDDPCNKGGSSYYKQANYTCCEILNCWRALVQNIVQIECKGRKFDFNKDGNLPDAMDEVMGDGVLDKIFDGSFSFINFIFRKKISKKIRDAKIPAPQFDLHLVHEFLNCTSYKFADVLDPNENNHPSEEFTKASQYKDEDCFIDLEADFDGFKGNGEYNEAEFFPRRYIDSSNVFDIDKKYFQTHNGNTNHKWRELFSMPSKGDEQTIGEMFPHIQHPVYAFKYYEYARSTYYTLEFATCFEDPNLCEVNGQTVPCCPNDVNQKCYFCGVGEVTCAYTKENWTSGQRETFYKMLKGRVNIEDEKPEVIASINCEMVGTPDRWYKPVLGTDDDLSLKYFTKDIYRDVYGKELIGIHVPQKNLKDQTVDEISYAEMKAVEMKDQCENRCERRKSEFRDSVIAMFESRCYILTDCKLDPDDNTYTWEDVDAITDRVFEQCISQCPITTYYCQTRNCRMADRHHTSPGTDRDDLELYLGIAGRPGLPGTENDCPPGANNEETNNCSGYERDNLSWSEFTKWHQAQNWRPQLRIPTKCDKDDDYDPGDCDNPDTYVEKDEYYVSPGNVPVSIDRQEAAVKGAISPKIDFDVKVGEE